MMGTTALIALPLTVGGPGGARGRKPLPASWASSASPPSIGWSSRCPCSRVLYRSRRRQQPAASGL